MHIDLRSNALFHEAVKIAHAIYKPGTGSLVDLLDLDIAKNGRTAALVGVMVEQMEGRVPSRLFVTDIELGGLEPVTTGSAIDRGCKFSPDGALLAFLSAPIGTGNFQLQIHDLTTKQTQAAAAVDGWVEYLHWAQDGRSILLGVAGHGADTSGTDGAVASKRGGKAPLPWMPDVRPDKEEFRRRSLWIYDLKWGSVKRIPIANLNVWEASWCGLGSVAAVASERVDEGGWYGAALYLIDVECGSARLIYKPVDQLGWPSCNPRGTKIAVVEAVCSDRGGVAGQLLIIDPTNGDVEHVSTAGGDVSYACWRSSDQVSLGFHRGFETAALDYDIMTCKLTEVWSNERLSASGSYIRPLPIGHEGRNSAFLLEDYNKAPFIAVTKAGNLHKTEVIDPSIGESVKAWVENVEAVQWAAPDGLEVHGRLLLPKGRGPFPVVMHVHGGPVFHWAPQWLGRSSWGLTNLLLLKHGYAVFQPNPRGSSGRGQDFASRIKGDYGGLDTFDLLAGLDHLAKLGVADEARIGVMGSSYGGFMTSWLVTQDQRFAAAVSVAPSNNHISCHLTSNIPDFKALFLGDRFDNPIGKYVLRSPVMLASRVRTPTLNIAGALDLCTPPSQALEFYSALREYRVDTGLVVYPEEGHGVQSFPAMFDYAARIVGWFEEHMHQR
ncbi:prolyl oligopeptidase family serine peptidase [Mesorhizobium sp. WSM3882]|uniref:S9 family peptidase n=1 Tax=Mesorhizobium sp. WSM3882 TaxID=2029407 RepID=UPI0015CB6CB2|nr:prolyl oligopeptidase family serine peptidase [Mesorhizobium sp. WSM3882]